MNPTEIQSICDKCKTLFNYMEMKPETTTNHYKHATSLYTSVVKHYLSN